jgi:hypothetical protein
MKRRHFLRSAITAAGGVAAITLTGTLFARRGGRGGRGGRRRPASPNSVAGVRRRSRRRTRRRIRRNMRLYSLPYGCTITRYRGSISYYYCSGIWYRPAYEGTTVIYIVEEIEPGSETYVEFE